MSDGPRTAKCPTFGATTSGDESDQGFLKILECHALNGRRGTVAELFGGDRRAGRLGAANGHPARISCRRQPLITP